MVLDNLPLVSLSLSPSLSLFVNCLTPYDSLSLLSPCNSEFDSLFLCLPLFPFINCLTTLDILPLLSPCKCEWKGDGLPALSLICYFSSLSLFPLCQLPRSFWPNCSCLSPCKCEWKGAGLPALSLITVSRVLSTT